MSTFPSSVPSPRPPHPPMFHVLCVPAAVYILDDGKDPDKKTWVESLKDPGMLYTPGHIKTGPEVNGKACNLNATLRALFPADSTPGLEEVQSVL